MSSTEDPLRPPPAPPPPPALRPRRWPTIAWRVGIGAFVVGVVLVLASARLQRLPDIAWRVPLGLGLAAMGLGGLILHPIEAILRARHPLAPRAVELLLSLQSGLPIPAFRLIEAAFWLLCIACGLILGLL